MVEVYKIVKLMNMLKRGCLFALFASKINEALKKAIEESHLEPGSEQKKG